MYCTLPFRSLLSALSLEGQLGSYSAVVLREAWWERIVASVLRIVIELLCKIEIVATSSGETNRLIVRASLINLMSRGNASSSPCYVSGDKSCIEVLLSGCCYYLENFRRFG